MNDLKIKVIDYKRFKLLLYVILIISINSTCIKEDCARTIDYIEFYSIVSDVTTEPSDIDGWYHSEFQKRPLHFAIEFQIYGAGEFCDYYWNNYPMENSIRISCDKYILVGNDTIKENENLVDLFTIQKFEKDFFITFLIAENTEKSIYLDSDYYTFTLNLETNKHEQMQDKCVVKLIK